MFAFRLVSISMDTRGRVPLKLEASLLGRSVASCYSYLHGDKSTAENVGSLQNPRTVNLNRACVKSRTEVFGKMGRGVAYR